MTPALPPRITLLRRLVDRQGGEWTPARTGRAYAAHGIAAPKRTTHRADLRLLHRLGVLNRHKQPGRTYYTAAGRTR